MTPHRTQSSSAAIEDEHVISDRMRRVGSKNTAPELTLRRHLRASGIRFSSRNKHLPGKPDFTIPGARIAVFVDGDLWHGLQWSRRGHLSLESQFSQSRTAEYWVKKIRRNMERDCKVTTELLQKGWRVVRFWESDVQTQSDQCIRKIMDAIEPTDSDDDLARLAQKQCAEFFAGIGLMRLGLENQGWSVAFANDIDRDKFDMYRANFDCSDGHFICEDIHRLSSHQVPSVALATASFPCNDLSLAGGRKGLEGAQSSAFWGFVELLDKLGQRKPPLILLENVTGFLTSHRGRDFADAMLALNRLNYAVDPFIIDAASFVPQSRQRLFVVAVSRSLHPSRAEETPAFFQSEVRPKALADFILAHPQIDWAIRKLPPPPRRTTNLRDVLEDIPHESPVWWNSTRADYLLRQMSPKHCEMANSMIENGDWSYGTVFRRVRNKVSMAELRVDGTAGCLRTPRGGSGRQILFKAGKGKYFVRLLTGRECARLMGADDFVVDPRLNKALFGFGDAVCVPVVEWIAKHYLNPLVTERLRGRVISSISFSPTRRAVAI
jgi:DNA (cytosine-5)-methyltransferase 1